MTEPRSNILKLRIQITDVHTNPDDPTNIVCLDPLAAHTGIGDYNKRIRRLFMWSVMEITYNDIHELLPRYFPIFVLVYL